MTRYRWNQNGLAGNVYMEGNESRIALVLSGLPYVPSEQGYFQDLQSAGYAVVQPQYLGTYDSEGLFSPDSAKRTVDLAVRLIRQGITDTKSENIVLQGEVALVVGQSFGSWVAYNSAERMPVGCSVLLLAPFLAMGKYQGSAGIRADLTGQAGYISRALPRTFRLHDISQWASFFSDGEFPFPEAQKPDLLPLILVTGGRDDSLDADAVLAAAEQHSDTAGLELIKFLYIPDAGHSATALFRGSHAITVIESHVG